MDCREIREYLYSFIDGELDSQTNSLVQSHISACPLCRLEAEQEKRIDVLIRAGVPRETAPFALKEAVLDIIRQPKKSKILSFALPSFRPALAAVLTILLIGLALFPVWLKKTRPFPLFNEAVAGHINFLQGRLPLEIVSGNPEDINNWFQGKLDFAIRTPDLSRSGVNLIGARLCHLKDKKGAFFIYEKEGQRISVFIFNTRGLNISKAKKVSQGRHVFFIRSEAGYQSILCLKKGSEIGCIFVSDLPEDELIKIIT